MEGKPGIVLVALAVTALCFAFAQENSGPVEVTTSSDPDIERKPNSSNTLDFKFIGRGGGQGGFRSRSLYFLSSRESSWADAFGTCTTRYGGHLVSLETEQESNLLRGLLIQNQIEQVWTSGGYNSKLGIWLWGALKGYYAIYQFDSRWITGEPATSNGYSKIVFYSDDFTSGFFSASRNEYFHSVCEI